MPKQFYTERDIDDLAKRGVQSLEVTDNVVLTELAFEKAKQLGIRLVQDKPEERPGAPIRPYLSKVAPAPAQPLMVAQTSARFVSTAHPPSALHDRILQAIHARLGNQLDESLLETIITRVLNSTGMK